MADPTWEDFASSLELPECGLGAEALRDLGPVAWDDLSAPLRSMDLPTNAEGRKALWMTLTLAEEFTPFLVVIGGQAKVLHHLKELRELEVTGERWGALGGDLRKVVGQHAFAPIFELAGATSRAMHVNSMGAVNFPVQSWGDIAAELADDADLQFAAREAGGASANTAICRALSPRHS